MNSDVQSLASIRGRLGFVGWGNTLFYVTGGAAWARMKYNAQETNSPPTFFTNFISNATLTNTKSGWVAGGGVETMVVPHILLRVEYLYYGLSNDESASAFLLPNPGAFPRAFNYSWSTNNIQVVRVGASYKF
jgi:outer membrane immunogenic protein